MDHIVESSTIEDFNDLPLKKAKSFEPDLINGDLLPSPDSLESDRKINSHPLPSPTSPIIQALSPNNELEDKQVSELDDDKQPKEDKQIKVDSYDYLPQGKFSFLCTFIYLSFSLL